MKKILLLLSLILSTQAFAQIEIPTLEQEDVDALADEFSSNFIHTSVSSAKSLGDIWGVEIGVLGGLTTAPKLEELVKEASPDEEISSIPHGGVFAAVSVPFGVTFEVSAIPEFDVSDATIEVLTAAVKWTFTDLEYFEDWPLTMAIRGHYASSKFSFEQTITDTTTIGNPSADGVITIDNNVTGLDLMLSYDFLFLEPYAVIGFANSSTDIIAEASNVTIFDRSDFPGLETAGNKTSVEANNTSVRFAAGIQFDLWLSHISVEYSSAFGTERVSAKTSFYF